MDQDRNRELQILNEIASGVHVTQRGLSKQLGVALGLTNLLIRRLVKKGAIKIINLQRNRVKYLITPSGIAEKARLSYEYLEYSLQLYRQIRLFLTEQLTRLDPAAGKQVVLYGTGEIAELASVVIQQHQCELAGVIDGAAQASTFLRHPVRPLSELVRLPFDRVVVAAFTEREAVRQRLLDVGVPEDAVITIPDVPALFRWRPAPSARSAEPALAATATTDVESKEDT